MAAPVAYFSYWVDDLTIHLANASYQKPTSFQWAFGDGETSTDESVEHTYASPGTFKISLIATNADGQSISEITINIGQGQTHSTHKSILELVDGYTSQLLSDEFKEIKVDSIRQWQLYLQPLVYLPYKVEDKYVHYEIKWPPLVNHLISQLVSYDLLVKQATRYSNLIYDSGISVQTSPGSIQQGEVDQQIKSIETGPAKTEWYEDQLSTPEGRLNIAKAFDVMTKQGGILDTLQETICQQSKRVRIYLPECGKLNTDVITPIVIKSRTNNVNATWTVAEARDCSK